MEPMPSPTLSNPVCPNCLLSFQREIVMNGPVPHPTDVSLGHFYVCPGCNDAKRTLEFDRRLVEAG